LRIAVVQHRVRTHERMDLAALLAMSEHASDEGAQSIVFPRIPGIVPGSPLLEAFFRNVAERCPGMYCIRPRMRHRTGEAMGCTPTALGRTIVLADDDCIDPALFPHIQALDCEALVWMLVSEDDLQAEAVLELALDASLTLAPLVIVVSVTGHARDVDAHGLSAIVHLGELVAEGGEGEDLLIADLGLPAAMTQKTRRLPEPTPVLLQRLAAHRGTKAPVEYPADLS